MRPTAFPQATGTSTAPPGMEKEVQPLPVFSDGRQCISLWKASLLDRLLILLTGRVWLSVMSGHTLPPVRVQAEHIFIRRSFATWLRHALLLMGDVRQSGPTPVPMWMFWWNKAVGHATVWLDSHRFTYPAFWLGSAAFACWRGSAAGSISSMGAWLLYALAALSFSGWLIYRHEVRP